MTQLSDALSEGRFAEIEQWLAVGSDGAFPDPDGITALHLAVLSGEISWLSDLIQRGADTNVKTTALVSGIKRHASGHGLQIVRPNSATFYLPDPRPEIGASGVFDKGATPLHMAAAIGDLRAVELLLEAKARPGIKDHFGATPLHLAAIGGHTDAALRLMRTKTDLNAKTKGQKSARFYDPGMTPLLAAAEGGQHRIVQALLEKGCEATIKTKTPCNAVFFAARGGSVQVLDSLIRAEARLAPKTHFQNSALTEAAKLGHLDMVHRLIELGAVTPERSSYANALEAAIKINHTPIRKALENAGAVAIEYLDIHHGVKSNDIPYLRKYLEAGGNPNSLQGRNTLLMDAAIENSKIACAVLLEHGADVNHTTPLGTALHVAASYRNYDVMHLLINAGANCGLTDSYGKQPLSMIITQQEPDYALVRSMLNAGADPFKKNNHDVSAYDLAERSRHDKLIKMFELHAKGPNQPIRAQKIAMSGWNWILYQSNHDALFLEVFMHSGPAYWSRFVKLTPDISPTDRDRLDQISQGVAANPYRKNVDDVPGAEHLLSQHTRLTS